MRASPVDHVGNDDKPSRPAKTPRVKRTTHITEQQAANALAALDFADAIGCPLNISVDINWHMFSGWTDDRTRMANFQPRLSKWCRRRGFPLTMIWVREIGEFGGLNAHLLMHCPPWMMEDREFEDRFEAELIRALTPEGGPNHEQALLIQHAPYPRGKLLYMLKGMRKDEAREFGVRAIFQGEIDGKRVGCTENIGPTARKRFYDAHSYRGTTYWLCESERAITAGSTSNSKSHKENLIATYALPPIMASKFDERKLVSQTPGNSPAASSGQNKL